MFYNDKDKDISSRVLYIVDYCLTPHEHIEQAGILCEGASILAIGGSSAFTKEEGLEVIHLEGSYAVPGFIDTHIHGAGAFDSSTADTHIKDMTSMCKTLASHGVTSFLPTIISSPHEKMIKVIATLAESVDNGYDGANPVGLNIEGPYINPHKHGAQKRINIRSFDIYQAKDLIDAGDGKIKIMTFAPELPHATKLIELLRENDIIPSMGHSTANEETVLRAIDAGALRCTHLFNGMPSLHQRDAGLAVLALVDNRVYVELILDNTLIHPRMIELACRSKPNDKIIGISDAVEGAGLTDGTYHLGESEISVINGKVTNQDGILAGTTQTLEKGWQHLAEASHMERKQAAACLSINPARSINLDLRGELKPGKLADIAFFNTKNHKAILTVSKGKVIYNIKDKQV